jgi:hypothetical protein
VTQRQRAIISLCGILSCLIAAVVVFRLADIDLSVSKDFQKNQTEYLKVEELRQKISAGTDIIAAVKEMLSLGYQIVMCTKKNSAIAGEKIICFSKSVCQPYRTDMVDMSITYDKKQKVVNINSGGWLTIHDKSCSDLPDASLKLNKEPLELIKNPREFFQKQLSILQGNFPVGSQVEALISDASRSGYSVQFDSCLKEHQKKIQGTAGCLSLLETHGTRSAIWQSYDVSYDDELKIMSIQMGISTSWKD